MAEKKFYNNFTFVGTIAVPKEESKVYEVKTWDSGWQTHKLNLSIKESATNSEFLDLTAMYTPLENNKVFLISKDGARLEVPFKDRNNQVVLDNVSDMRKLVVDLETDQAIKSERIGLEFKIRNIERRDNKTDEDLKTLTEYRDALKILSVNKHEFLHEYDFIRFIKESVGTLSQHKVRATGNISIEESKGKYYTKYIPKKIEIVSEEVANTLTANYDVFFNKSSLDESALEEDKKIFVDAYVLSYDRRAKADRYFPKQFVFNATALDFTNPQHTSYLNMLKGFFDVKSKKNYYHLVWQTAIYKGAEIVEFNESMLTQKQRELIAFGLKTIEDFKPRNNVYGNRISEVRLITPNLKDEFVDGAVDTGLREDDFYEMLALSTQDVKAEDVKKVTVTETKTQTTSVEDQLKALFNPS